MIFFSRYGFIFGYFFLPFHKDFCLFLDSAKRAWYGSCCQQVAEEVSKLEPNNFSRPVGQFWAFLESFPTANSQILSGS